MSKNKSKSLNLNIYRNLHFYQLNHQKKIFGERVKLLLRHIPKLGRIHLHYVIFPKTKAEFDLMNVGSIVDKYFSDTLVNCGILIDDNVTFIDSVSFGFGGFAKRRKAYAIVTITEIEPRKGNDMRILLDQADIQNALDAFVMTQGITGATGVEMTVGGDGQITAEVMIGNTAVASPADKPKSRGGRPRGSKNKAKPVATEEVETNVETDGSDGPSDGNGGGDPGPETETPDSPAENTSEGKESKNLFGDSPEESSTADGAAPETEPDTNGSEDKPEKKSSIFDT